MESCCNRTRGCGWQRLRAAPFGPASLVGLGVHSPHVHSRISKSARRLHEVGNSGHNFQPWISIDHWLRVLGFQLQQRDGLSETYTGGKSRVNLDAGLNERNKEINKGSFRIRYENR